MYARFKVIAGLLLVGTLIRFILSDCPLVPSDFVFPFAYSTQIAEPSVSPLDEILNATLFFPRAINYTNHSLDDSNSTHFSKGLCPIVPSELVGPIRVWLDGPSEAALNKLYGERLELGGHGQPGECVSRHRVAIVIPYRNRELQLRILLHNLHALLAKQQLDYGIYVVEQANNSVFNRAKLMNVGFVESLKDYPWDCFVFHDVDLLPEDDRNMYSCPAQPRHMSVAIDKFSYKLPYGSIFGGICAMTREQMEKINGFSNDYWGWGGEDDDLSTRVSLAGFKISRYPTHIARYQMIRHSHEANNPVNSCRYKLMSRTRKRWQSDGLNSLKYMVTMTKKKLLYTLIQVDLLQKNSQKALRAVIPTC